MRRFQHCYPADLLLNLLHRSYIQVPFLNLMSLLAERAGQVIIRVGGNTQDYATLVASTSDGRMLEKQSIDPNNPVRPSVSAFEGNSDR